MRTLREAGAGGVEPPSTVLETAMLPVTPCSRDSLKLPGNAGVPPARLVRDRLSRKHAGGTPALPEVDAKSMLSEGIEPPMNARVAWSTVRCNATLPAQRFEDRASIRLSKNKGSESFRTQSAETARSFCLFYRTGS